MPEPKKDFFRKYLTRKQAFVLLNAGGIAVTYLQGGCELTPRSVTAMAFALLALNIGAYLSMKHYPDWE